MWEREELCVCWKFTLDFCFPMQSYHLLLLFLYEKGSQYQGIGKRRTRHIPLCVRTQRGRRRTSLKRRGRRGMPLRRQNRLWKVGEGVSTASERKTEVTFSVRVSSLKCSKEGKCRCLSSWSVAAILLFTRGHLLPCVGKSAARLGTQSPLWGLKVSISSSSCAPDSSVSGTTGRRGGGEDYQG